MEANNVVQFPKKRVTNEITLEDIVSDKKAIHDLHIDEAMMVGCEALFDHLDMMRFDFEGRSDLTKDINLVFESVKALLSKYYGYQHQLNNIAERMFVFEKAITFEPAANTGNTQIEFTSDFEV